LIDYYSLGITAEEVKRLEKVGGKSADMDQSPVIVQTIKTLQAANEMHYHIKGLHHTAYRRYNDIVILFNIPVLITEALHLDVSANI